jgi:hypothetical protein
MALVEGEGGPAGAPVGGGRSGRGATPPRPSAPAPTLGGSNRKTTLQPMPTWTDTVEREDQQWIGDESSAEGYGRLSPVSWFNPADLLGKAVTSPDKPTLETVTVEKEVEREEKKPAVAKELTWERYNNLPALQRAAVDFNTLLVQAREKDLKNQDSYDPTEQEQRRYDRKTEKMFGEDGTSEIYAPETFGLLQQLEFEPEKNVDLDEFLSLKAAVSAKDLKGFATEEDPLKTMIEPRTEQFDLGQEMAVETRQLQATMAKTTGLLQNFHERVALARNDYTDFYGGKPTKGEMPLGLGEGELDTTFKTAFEYLADRATGMDAATLPGFLASGSTPEQRAAFIRYVDDRTKTASRYDLDIGADDSNRYLNAQQIRAMFGLDGGE